MEDNWVQILAIVLSILGSATVGIRKLSRIEANTESHAKQIDALFTICKETRDDVSDHKDDCDKDRVKLSERQNSLNKTVEKHDLRITNLETG